MRSNFFTATFWDEASAEKPRRLQSWCEFIYLHSTLP